MSQKSMVFAFCESRPRGYFRLADAYDALPNLPMPTIRNLLQAARDAGLIAFVDNRGLYLR